MKPVSNTPTHIPTPIIIQQMSSKSLARRRITAQQAKEVFKTAFQKRPESIERLKESVAVSVGKY